MSTAVLSMQTVAQPFEHEIMMPSPTTNKRPKHERGQSQNKVGRGRANTVDLNEREVEISKAMTYILRQAAKDNDDELVDEDGQADCGEIVRLTNLDLGISREDYG